MQANRREVNALKPWDLLAKVLPMSRFSKTLGAFKSNQSIIKASELGLRVVQYLILQTFAGEGVDDLFLKALLAF